MRGPRGFSFSILRDLAPHQGPSPEKFIDIVGVSVPCATNNSSRQADFNEFRQGISPAADISGDGFRALQDFGGFCDGQGILPNMIET